MSGIETECITMREHEVDMNRGYKCRREAHRIPPFDWSKYETASSWVVGRKMTATRTLIRRSSELEVIYIRSVSWVIVRQINTNERYINIIDGENTDFLNVIIGSVHAHREV